MPITYHHPCNLIRGNGPAVGETILHRRHRRAGTGGAEQPRQGLPEVLAAQLLRHTPVGCRGSMVQTLISHFNLMALQIARVRIDRSMIGSPTDFRHIGHMGASDTSGSSYDVYPPSHTPITLSNDWVDLRREL